MKRALRNAVRSVKEAPVIGTIIAVLRRYGADGGGLLAGAITYAAFLSLFPLILLGLAAIGFVLDDPAQQQEWTRRLSGSVPGLRSLIGDSIGRLAEDRAAIGVIGLVSLAWIGTNVVRSAGTSVSAIFNVPPLGGLRSQAWAIGSLLALGTLALVSIGASTFVSALGRNAPAWFVVAPLVSLAFDFVMFAVAYRILTQRRGPAFADLWPGALLAAAGWTLLKAIGVWYATRTVGNAAAVYGAFAATVGVLVLLSLASRLFLYGAELNVILLERKQPMNERKAISLARHRARRAGHAAR